MCIEFKYVNGAHCVVCLFQIFFKTNNGKKPLKFGFLLGIYCMLLVSILSNPTKRFSCSFYFMLEVLKFRWALKRFCVNSVHWQTFQRHDACASQQAKCYFEFSDECQHLVCHHCMVHIPASVNYCLLSSFFMFVFVALSCVHLTVYVNALCSYMFNTL